MTGGRPLGVGACPLVELERVYDRTRSVALRARVQAVLLELRGYGRDEVARIVRAEPEEIALWSLTYQRRGLQGLQMTRVTPRPHGLVVETERQAYGAAVPSPGPEWDSDIRAVYLELRSRLFDPTLSTGRVLARLGIREKTFPGRFAMAVGTSPKAWVLHHRFELSLRLLSYAQVSILRVALGVGFSSHAAFSRGFKRREGTCPSSWRRQQASGGLVGTGPDVIPIPALPHFDTGGELPDP